MGNRNERPDPGFRDGRSYCYGVYGLSEWVVLIPIGGAKLRLTFTGGSASECGLRPATFVTKNIEIARAIEQSEYYRSGRIEGIRVY